MSTNETSSQQASEFSSIRKVKWSDEEDEMLRVSVQKYGTSNWSLVASMLSGRTGKQCRERWTNQINPELNKQAWREQEDILILQLHQTCGNSWSAISKHLPGRSSNSVKNRWGWLQRHNVNLFSLKSHHMVSPPIKMIVPQIQVQIIPSPPHFPQLHVIDKERTKPAFPPIDFVTKMANVDTMIGGLVQKAPDISVV